MNKIYINGIDISNDVSDGLAEIEIELGLNQSTKTIGKSFSSDITVEGITYDMLNQFFFSDCKGWEKTLPALFKTDICGGIEIECEITSEGLENDFANKKITFNIKSGDQISRAYARLDSELITDNGFAETNDTPIMYYVDEPGFLQWAVLLLTLPIRQLVKILDLLPFVNLSEVVFGAFDTWITGTGRWAPAPLIREMINHQCQSVGLRFQSSILNEPSSPRYNLSMFCLTGGDHGDFKDTSKVEIVDKLLINSPQYTTIGLLEKLKDVFAADYRIIGNTLVFERLDYFDEIRTIPILNTSDVCLDESIKVGFKTFDAVAYGEYMYTTDAFDHKGNQVQKAHYQYFDKLEFNLPYNPSQKGKKTRNLYFGCPRFMFDEKSFKRKSFFNLELFMDEFRDGPERLIFGFSTEGYKSYFDLKLSGSICSLEKLLVLEPNFDRKNAQTIKRKIGNKGGQDYYSFNEPMHIDVEANYPELAKDFFWVDNPRLRKDIYTVSDIEIDCDCNAVLLGLNEFQKCFIIDKYVGKIIPETILISISEKITLSFRGNRGLCQ